MSKVTYFFCPLEGRYAARGEDLIFQDDRFVNTNKESWVAIKVNEDGDIDKAWKNNVVPKEIVDKYNSVIRLTHKQFILYNLIKDRKPLSKKEILELGKPEISKANIHRALASDFEIHGIKVIRTVKGNTKLFSIETPKKDVIQKEKQGTILHLANQRDVEIIKLHNEGITLEKIGEMFNISRQRVQQILVENKDDLHVV
jgi:hypothetical protein